MRPWGWIAVGVVAVATFVAEALAPAHYWWERIPAFYALFGFLGCLLLIVVAKTAGKLLIQRPEEPPEESDA